MLGLFRRRSAAAVPPRELSFSERYAPPPPGLLRRTLRALLELSRALLALTVLVAVAYLGWLAVTWSERLSDPPAAPATVRLPGAKPVELTLDSADGTRLHATYVPAKGKSDATIVLVHDWGASGATMLARDGRTVWQGANLLALDLRGHGRSAGRATLGPAEAEDVAAAVAEAVRRGARRVVIVGEGLGAVAGLAAAESEPQVAAVVAVSPYLRLVQEVERRMTDEAVAAAQPGSWAVLLGLLFRAGRDVSATDAEAVLPRLDVPTFVVAAAEDRLLPEDTLRQLVAERTGLEVWLVAGAQRETIRQTAGREYAQRLRAFLDRHLSRKKTP
ncbi:MAG TPA: alpha/beta fold hydrolase [Candidatus Limnocylindrales bacterium]|nr:alpha/beta fold hydrolase [Candidatus Limnocylindrales bacterium]